MPTSNLSSDVPAPGPSRRQVLGAAGAGAGALALGGITFRAARAEAAPGGNLVVPAGQTVTISASNSYDSITVNGTLVIDGGSTREAWTKLHETANAGATSAHVMRAAGWRAGDRIIFTPTGQDSDSFEERTVTGVVDHGAMWEVTFSSGLGATHEVVHAAEPDEGDEDGHVHFAGEVINMTRSIDISTGSFLVEGGRTLLNDVRISGARVQWHDTNDGGRCTGVIVEGTQGGCYETENAQNLLWEDCIAYDSVAIPWEGSNKGRGAGFGWSEITGKGGPNGNANPGNASGVYAVHCLAANIRRPGGSQTNGLPYGYYISGLGSSDDPEGIAGVLGCVAVGIGGSGYWIQESGGAGMQHFWRNDAHHCADGFQIDGNNYEIAPDGQPFVSFFFWRNSHMGLFWGSYNNLLEMHHAHFLGNGTANVGVLNSDALWSRFVCDGEGVSEANVAVLAYVTPSKHRPIYARTKMRNVGGPVHFQVDPDFDPVNDTAVVANRHIDWPAVNYDSTGAFSNFCEHAETTVFPNNRNEGFVGSDDMRVSGTESNQYRAPCSVTALADSWITLPDVTTQTSQLIGIQAPNSRYVYYARKVGPISQPGGLRPLEDWTMVVENDGSEPLPPGIAYSAPTPFTDIASSYAKAHIERLYGLGIVAGTSSSTYSPQANVTREQMAVYLMRSWEAHAGHAYDGDVEDFTDISGSYARDFIRGLAGTGITAGCGPQTYCPGQAVTREQMAVFLIRLWESCQGRAYNGPVASGEFGDVAGSFARVEIEQLAGLGVTAGTAAGVFSPAAVVTREQMAVFVSKLLTSIGV